jgi:peptide/nickel transport system permease protein
VRPRNPLLAIGILLIVVQALGALAVPFLPYAPDAQDILARFAPPSMEHWMGTDQFGRDILARVLAGERVLFAVSLLSVSGALAIGGTIGIAASWLGGRFDTVLMRLMDVLFAFPIILLAIGIVAIMGPGTTGTALAIAVVYTPIFARVLRAPALVLREADYVAASRSIGATPWRLLWRHVVPNLAPVILVQASLSLSTAILVEASLSFLGLGTQPPAASLGRMLSEARGVLAFSPWPAVFSGLAILLAALGFNLLGDGLQDRLDPRLRTR